MEMTGLQLVQGSPQATWEALNDADVLKACIPGCESISSTAEDAMQVVMVARIGPISAKFTGLLKQADIDPLKSYSLNFKGQGGAAGFATGSAHVTLTAEGPDTRLSYVVTANVGGKLAQIGSRLIDSVAKKVADDFFKSFNVEVNKRNRGADERPVRLLPS